MLNTNSMLLESRGLQIDNFFIPPFTINKGEIVTICLFGGGHFFDLEAKLVNIFTGKVKNVHVDVYGQFKFIKNTQDFTGIPNIIFDLVGLGFEKSIPVYESIKQHVKEGGAAIFFDNFVDPGLYRTKYIEIKIIE